MAELKPCPVCGVPPKMAYVCGEYFVMGENDNCPYCGNAFTEMHSNERIMEDAWNRRADDGK